MESKNKRITAHLIPYRIVSGVPYFFLQKRSDKAQRNPGQFTIFGGGVEGEEDSEHAMLREMREELNFTPDKYFYIGEYTDDYSISYYYAIRIGDDFETKIKIGEGSYGRFFSENQLKNETKISESNKAIIEGLSSKIGTDEKTL